MNACRLIAAAEERELPDRGFLLLERRFLERAVKDCRVLRAMSAEIVERARGDQRFENALIAEAQIDAIS